MEKGIGGIVLVVNLAIIYALSEAISYSEILSEISFLITIVVVVGVIAIDAIVIRFFLKYKNKNQKDMEAAVNRWLSIQLSEKSESVR